MNIPLFVWLSIDAVVMFGVGLFVGSRLGRTRPATAQREVEELKAALRQHQDEARHYRTHVAQHFTQTADLLQALTADYRAVYEHLAAGAQTLCDGQVGTLTSEALREYLLAAPSKEGTQAETPVPQPPSPLPLKEDLMPQAEDDQKRQPDSVPTPVHPEPEGTRATEPLPLSPHEDMQQKV